MGGGRVMVLFTTRECSTWNIAALSIQECSTWNIYLETEVWMGRGVQALASAMKRWKRAREAALIS